MAIRSLSVIHFLLMTGAMATAGPLERAAPETQGFSAERLERLSTALEAYVDD